MSEIELFTLPSVAVGVTVSVPPSANTPMYNLFMVGKEVVPPEFEALTVYQAKELKTVGVPVITQLELIDNPVGRDGEVVHDVGIPPPAL